MEQRIYHGGNATAEGLANFLVQQYEHDDHDAAQKLGEGKAFIVQIGRRDPEHAHDRALTIGISPSSEDAHDITVTMGSQQWLSNTSGYAVIGTMIGALFTPWALFGLLWPLTEALTGRTPASTLWNQIDAYMIGQGATLAQTQQLQHPHSV
jgi:hypothetical protein